MTKSWSLLKGDDKQATINWNCCHFKINSNTWHTIDSLMVLLSGRLFNTSLSTVWPFSKTLEPSPGTLNSAEEHFTSATPTTLLAYWLTSEKCSDGGLRTGAAGMPSFFIIICRFVIWGEVSEVSRVKPWGEQEEVTKKWRKKVNRRNLSSSLVILFTSV